MKKTELTEVKNLDEKALNSKAKELRAKIADQIVDKQMNKLKDLKTIAKTRQELAKTLTVLRQKVLIREYESMEGAK